MELTRSKVTHEQAETVRACMCVCNSVCTVHVGVTVLNVEVRQGQQGLTRPATA